MVFEQRGFFKVCTITSEERELQAGANLLFGY